MTQTSENVADWLNYLTRNELALLKEIAAGLPPNPLVVNIGAGHGTATLGVLEVRPDALIFSIDTTAGEDPINTGEHLRLQEAGLHLTGSVIRIWGASQIVGKRWRSPADLVIVDGDHSAEGIGGDIAVWRPQIAKGGVLLFHDYGRGHWPAVKVAVDTAFQGILPMAYVDTYIAFREGELLHDIVKESRPGGYYYCERRDRPSC